jgi:hypothetical protein
MSTKVLSPEEFFGHKMGADRKLARWDRIVEYFWQLDASPRVKVTELGKTTMGNPFLLAIISSPENLENIEKIRETSLHLAHPRGLSEQEAEKMVAEGKTVVSMMMSVHASEIGGSQMAPELAYELATSEEPEVQRILENTVLVLVPSSNPDGNILVVDWYNRWLGTEYEGTAPPFLYHKYIGHDNNRDCFHITQAESKMLTKMLYKDWYPQAQIDFHHMGSYAARFYIPPHMDPLYENTDPLAWTEQQLYGGAMLMELEAAGKTGVETQASYPADGGPYWDEAPLMHGICGMLTESASASLATPIYVHQQQLEPSRRGRPENRTQMNFPHPWPGGWWRLRDVVEQQKIAALATLKTAAGFREKILHNMYLKARRQIEAGASEPPYAFILSPEQHDPLTAYRLLRMLQDADVEVHRAKEEFRAEGGVYPAGTYVVFASQTCRPYVLRLLKQSLYHFGPWSRTPDGAPLPPYDLAANTLGEFMGVKFVEASKPIRGSFELCEPIEPPKGGVEQSDRGYLLDGRLNESFAVVCSLLKKGKAVCRVLDRVGDLPVGSFYIPAQEGLDLAEYVDRRGILFHAVKQDFRKWPLRTLRIGMYQRYHGGNMDEGWTRWLLEQYGFEYTTIRDDDVKEKNGKLIDRFDVIILPDDDRSLILGENLEEYYRKTRPRAVPPSYPPEYQSGIGKEGVEKLRSFVGAGGTLITLGNASNLALEDLKMPFTNAVKDLAPRDFLCPGSTLKVKIDGAHPLAYGVAEDALILYRGSCPAFEIKQAANNDDYRVVISFPEEQILQSGWLIGERYLSNRAALIDARLGRGHVILYGFSPQLRAMTASTFKLLFNSLLR